jgi:hypothetical protein
MRIRLYKIRTYAQLDTWSRGTKRTQTNPILTKKPLPARQKTSLTSFLARPYATTPQTQKRTQTNPISSLAGRSEAQIHPRPTPAVPKPHRLTLYQTKQYPGMSTPTPALPQCKRRFVSVLLHRTTPRFFRLNSVFPAGKNNITSRTITHAAITPVAVTLILLAWRVECCAYFC